MLGIGAEAGTTASATPDAPLRDGSTDTYAAERDAWTVLASVDRLGPVAFGALLAQYRTAQAVLVAASEAGGPDRLTETPAVSDKGRRPVPIGVAIAVAAAAGRADAIVTRVHRLGIRVVTIEEPAYPERLAAIEMPPHVLFVHGSLDALTTRHAIAVVGTRHATTSGRTLAGRIAAALSASGACVVSGLAFGIDGAAHEATIRAGGTTVAVIGGGHAVLSPSTHARLAAAIIGAGGAVVSELAPDVAPTHGTFPRRNRIISGLSQATVVVEAPARSGALITASWALEQGRDCYLVPGPIDAPASSGCLSFLREFRDEARLVAGIPQLIADLGLSQEHTAERIDAVAAATLDEIGTTEATVAGHLLAGRVTVDEIVASTGHPVATILTTLAMLERRGLAVGVHGRYRASGSLLGAPPRPRPR
jgi:DNA processing protein